MQDSIEAVPLASSRQIFSVLGFALEAGSNGGLSLSHIKSQKLLNIENESDRNMQQINCAHTGLFSLRLSNALSLSECVIPCQWLMLKESRL